MLRKAIWATSLAALLTFAAAPVADVAWVEEREVQPRSLLGSYLAGRLANSARDNDRAAQFFENVLTKDPENEFILERTFRLEAASGNWARATRLAEDVITAEPSHQLARFVLAAEEFKKKNYQGAKAHFMAASKGALPELTAKLSLAWTHLAEGKTDKALGEVAKMKKADWSLFYQQYHKGLIADVAGRSKTARTALSRAFTSRPRTLRIAEAYARHAGYNGNNKLAKQILRKHIGKSTGHPIAVSLLDRLNAGEKPARLITNSRHGLAEVYYVIGDALTGEDSTDVGLIYLRIALQLKPEFPLAFLAVGETYDRLDRFEPAIKAYDKVRKSSPIWKNVQIRKAYALNSMEDVDAARALLVSLADESADDIRIYDALGSILRSRQKYAEAEKYYGKAIALVKKPEKRHWSLFYARGVCREQQKNWKDAEGDLEMALKLNPDQPLVLNYLGYSWVDQGVNLKRAMNLIRKAVKLKPDDGYFVDSLGWAYYRQGQFKQAVKHLERAVELRPEDPVINDHLGDAYWRVGRTLEAEYQWSQSLTLDPEPEEERKIKKKLAEGLKDGDGTRAMADTAETAPSGSRN